MGVHSTIAQMGWVDGTLYLLNRVLERGSRGRVRIVKYCLVAQPIGRSDTRRMRPDTATVLRQVGPNDPLVARFPRPAAVIARRFADGAVCTVALVRDEFAGFIWTQRERYEEDEVRCTYQLAAPALSVWDFDVYVEPRFRAGRTMARLWSQVDDELAATGIRWSFSRISAFNRVSLAAHARLGIVPCGSVLFLCAGPLQLFCAARSPFLHLSRGACAAPCVMLRLPA
jgi:GNAT superfamily N-acetyltransferase